METSIPILPEDAVYKRSARLLAVRDAVADVFGGNKLNVTDPSDLKEIVKKIRRAITAVTGAYGIIIGGLAVQELGYLRWTEDVDVVVDAEHFGGVLEYLRSDGFVLKVDCTLELADTGAKLDLLKEGTVLKDARLPLPHPSELGPNRGFATLSAIIRLKLDAHRMKDFADIVELLKKRLTETSSIRQTLPEIMREQFDQLAAEARREAGESS